MSAELIESAPRPPQLRGVVMSISPATLDQYWAAVSGTLQIMEQWTQLLCAADIYRCLADGRMQLWAVFDHAGSLALAITRIAQSSRGSICTVWLVSSQQNDDPSISAVLDTCESFARQQGCVVFEINAPPPWANRIKGKLTAVTIERDLRPARGVN